MERYSPAFLQGVARDVFRSCGSPMDEADIVAEHLVTANLMGMDSHGVVRIPQYVQWIREGTIKPGAPVTVANEEGGTAIVDCGFNFGQVGGLKAMGVAIDKAREHKVACVLTQRCIHIGRVGHYTELAARAGMFSIATGNVSAPIGRYVVPFGGTDGRLGTNPLSYAAPSRGDPIVADMATSTVSEGKVRIYRNREMTLPEGLILDNQGQPTVDAKTFYATPRGSILPHGGTRGYKGFALTLLAEILSGTLAGDSITEDMPNGTQGVCFIAIDISAFTPLARFRDLVAGLADYVKSSPPAEGVEEVLVPGEIEFRTKAEREAVGIPVEPSTWQVIQKTADELGVEIAEPR